MKKEKSIRRKERLLCISELEKTKTTDMVSLDELHALIGKSPLQAVFLGFSRAILKLKEEEMK